MVRKRSEDPHKYQVKEQRDIYLSYEPVDDLIENLRRLSEGLEDATLQDISWGGDPDWRVCGWRPMTDKELAKEKAKEAKERADRKVAREKKAADEQATYERLKAKYGD